MNHEEELVEQVLHGNQNAFKLLLHPYQKGLLNMAYRMTGSPEEAQDVCQEAMIKIFRYLHTFKKGNSFRSWVYKTVVNSSYDYLKRKRRYREIVHSQKSMKAPSESSPEEHFLQEEIGEKIEHCLQSLSPREKAVFLLRDGEGFSIREASKILGCSSSSIRTHLCRARRKIRVDIEKIYPLRSREVKR